MNIEQIFKQNGLEGLLTNPVIAEEIMKAGFGSPSTGDVHVDAILTNISLAFMQDMSNFVARRAFPEVSVSKQSDVYFTYPRGEFNRDQMEERAPGTESAGANYRLATQGYRCRVYALHKNLDDQTRSNVDSPLQLDRETTMFLTLKAMLNQEIDWVGRYMGGTGLGFSAAPGGTWTFAADGVAAGATARASLDFTDGANNNVLQWSVDGSSPIENIRDAKRAMLQETGFEPNVLVMGRSVADILKDHPDLIDRIDRGQTSGAAQMTMEGIRELFELDEILVSNAIQNTGKLGAAANHSFIAGDNALLLYRPPAAGLMTPAAGYTFLWSGFVGANNGGLRIKNFRIETHESDRIEAQVAYDHNRVAADLGLYWNDIV
jgi:hypothetical protein